jgi:DMSO/TMAO reductase YedYZ heme-binding membrane subunit
MLQSLIVCGRYTVPHLIIHARQLLQLPQQPLQLLPDVRHAAAAAAAAVPWVGLVLGATSAAASIRQEPREQCCLAAAAAAAGVCIWPVSRCIRRVATTTGALGQGLAAATGALQLLHLCLHTLQLRGQRLLQLWQELGRIPAEAV